MRQLHAWTAGSKSWLGLVGMVLCLGACYAYNDETLFPGAAALPPVVGTMLMIRYGATGWAGRVLCSRLFVGIGKISYSLYLWHWPLIVFWRYISDDSVNPWGLASVFVASMVLAWASWRFVEMPVRLAKSWNLKRALAWVVIGCGFIGGASVWLLTVAGIVPGITARQPHLSALFWQGKASQVFQPPTEPPYLQNATQGNPPLCVLGEDEYPQYVLFGDSHAGTLVAGFEQFSEQTGLHGLYISHSVALNKTTDYSWGRDNRECAVECIKWVKTLPVKNVILVNLWTVRADGTFYPPNEHKTLETEVNGVPQNPAALLEESMIAICQELKDAGKNVIIIGGIPEQGYLVSERYAKWKQMGQWLKLEKPLGIKYSAYQQRQKKAKDILEKIDRMGLAKLIWVDQYFFPKQYPDEHSRIEDENGNCLYQDDNHPWPGAARSIIKHYTEVIRNAMKQRREGSAH